MHVLFAGSILLLRPVKFSTCSPFWLLATGAAATLAGNLPASAACSPVPTAGNDSVFCSGTITGNIDLLDGDDFVSLGEGSIVNGRLLLGQGQDTAIVAGRINGKISTTFSTNGGQIINPAGQEQITIESTGSIVNTDPAPAQERSAITITGSAQIINHGLIDNSAVGAGPHTDALYFAYTGAGGTSVENVIVNSGSIIAKRAAIQDASNPGATRRYTVTNTGLMTGFGNDPVIRFGDANGDDIIRNDGGTITHASKAIQMNFGADQLFNINGGTIVGSIDLGATHAGDGGDYLFNDASSSITGNVLTGDGDDIVENWGALLGDISMGAGTDQLILGGAARLAPGALLDGGADGAALNDTLTLSGWRGSLLPGQVTNWSQIDLRAGTDLTIGAGTVNFDGLANGLLLQPDSVLRLNGSVTLSSHASNAGLIDLTADGNAPGNVLTVNGNYTGGTGGSVQVDTVLNDGSVDSTDRLHVIGNSQGHTLVKVINAGGAGALTGSAATDGIQIITVDGVSGGTFSLANRVTANQYGYQLVQADGQNWYLQSFILPQMAAYEGISPLLRQDVDPLAIRKQGRQYGQVPSPPTSAFAATSYFPTAPLAAMMQPSPVHTQEGMWARIKGTASRMNDNRISAGNMTDAYEQTSAGFEFGLDHTYTLPNDETLTAGWFAFFDRETMQTRREDGRKLLDMLGGEVGLGGEVTYQPSKTSYVDLVGRLAAKQMEIAVPDRDLSSTANIWSGTLAAEYGNMFSMSDVSRLTPYGQVMLGATRMSKFIDEDGVAVHAAPQASLRLRAGARYEQQIAVGDAIHMFHIDGNLSYDPLGPAEVTYFNEERHLAQSRLWGGAHVGVNSHLSPTQQINIDLGGQIPLDRHFDGSYNVSLRMGMTQVFQ